MVGSGRASDATSPAQRLWAGWAPLMDILDHVGRRSGRSYRTPLIVFSTPDGVAILLTYGRDRDWVKNLASAGGGECAATARPLASAIRG